MNEVTLCSRQFEFHEDFEINSTIDEGYVEAGKSACECNAI